MTGGRFLVLIVLVSAFAGCSAAVEEQDLDSGRTLPLLDPGLSLTFRLDSPLLFSLSSETYLFSAAPDSDVAGVIGGSGAEQLIFSVEDGAMKIPDPWGRLVAARSVLVEYRSPNVSGVVGREWVDPESGSLIRADSYQAWFQGPVPYASVGTEQFERTSVLDASVFAGRTLRPGTEFTVAMPRPLAGVNYIPAANQSFQFRVVGVEGEAGKPLLRVDLVRGTFVMGPFELPMVGSFWFDGVAPTFVKRTLTVTVPPELQDRTPEPALHSNVTLVDYEIQAPPRVRSGLRGNGTIPNVALEPFDGFAPPEGNFQGRFTLREAELAGRGLDAGFTAYRAQHPDAQVFSALYQKEINGTAETWELELTNPAGDALYRVVVGKLTSTTVTAVVLYYVEESTSQFEPSGPPVYLDATTVPPLAPYSYVLNVMDALLPGEDLSTISYSNSHRDYSVPLSLPEGVLAGIAPVIEIGSMGGYLNLYEGPVSRLRLAGLPEPSAGEEGESSRSLTPRTG